MSQFTVEHVFDEAHTEGIWTSVWCDSENLATAGLDGKVKLWDTRNRTAIKDLDNNQWGILKLSHLTSENILAASSIDNSFRIYDTKSQQLIYTHHLSSVENWGISIGQVGDNVHIATSSRGGHLNVFSFKRSHSSEIESGEQIVVELISSLPISNGFASDVTFSNDGKYLAGCTMDGIVGVYDTETHKRLHHIEAHGLPVRSIDFAADSTQLFTASDDKRINVYDVRSGSLIESLYGHKGLALSVRCSSSNQYIATGASDGEVRIWDLRKRKTLQTFQHHTDQVWTVSWSPASTKLVSGSDDRSFTLFQSHA